MERHLYLVEVLFGWCSLSLVFPLSPILGIDGCHDLLMDQLGGGLLVSVRASNLESLFLDLPLEFLLGSQSFREFFESLLFCSGDQLGWLLERGFLKNRFGVKDVQRLARFVGDHCSLAHLEVELDRLFGFLLLLFFFSLGLLRSRRTELGSSFARVIRILDGIHVVLEVDLPDFIVGQ